MKPKHASARDSVSRLSLKIAENQWILVEFLRFLVRVLLLFTIGNLKNVPTKNENVFCNKNNCLGVYAGGGVLEGGNSSPPRLRKVY